MKKVLVLFALVALLFAGCSKKNNAKMEVTRFESVALQIDSLKYEYNVVVNLKGFSVDEKNKNFYSKLTYTLDLVDSKGNKVEKVTEGKDDKSQPEKIEDVRLDLQFTSDKITDSGYELVLHIKDELNGRTLDKSQKFSSK